MLSPLLFFRSLLVLQRALPPHTRRPRSKSPLIRGDDTFPLRLAAWGFIKDGLPRLAAGVLGWSAGGSPAAVDLLCIGSYLTEVLQYGSEALIFGSTDLGAVIGNLLIPTIVSVSIYLSTGGLKSRRSQKAA